MDMISNIIAERDVIFVDHEGQTYDCRFIFGAIYQTDSGWCCPIQIYGYGDQKIINAYGVDSFQALQTAFELMNVQIDILGKEGKFIEEGIEISSVLPRDL